MEINTTIPFEKWFKSLKNKKVRVYIQSRFLNIELNKNFGDCKSLKGGLYELRIHISPGYRIYFARKKGSVEILAGGTKSNQHDLIKKLKKGMLP